MEVTANKGVLNGSADSGMSGCVLPPSTPQPLVVKRRTQRIRAMRAQQFTCADLDHHLAGECDGRVKVGKELTRFQWEGVIFQCPKCLQVFRTENSHCLAHKHLRCTERLLQGWEPGR